MTNTLPIDRYYRGYRLSKTWVTDHWVFKVYYGSAWVDSFLHEVDAKAQIDEWQAPR
jgi:hypothetical protein